MSLIEHFPKTLLDDLTDGHWLPIVGAGFSRNASYADGEPPVDWRGLGRALAADIDGVDDVTNAVEILSAYEHSYGRVNLVDRTARLIRAYDAAPGPAHRSFAKIGFREVLTTNFDFLLERAYEAVGKSAMPVIEEGQLASPNRRSGPRLIKLHGDIDHPARMVITEDDYDQFLQRYPLLATAVTAMLVDRTAILLGYSLDDPDTRQLLVLIKRRLGRLSRYMWTIQIDAPMHVISRYERRGVRVVNLPRLSDVSISAQYELLFEELGTYWRNRLSETAIGADDRVTADLRATREASRICYFAVPGKTLSWYKEIAFPEFEARGYVPAAVSDMISAEPGNIATTIEMLIERAHLVVVEVAGAWAEYEASLAIAKKGGDRVLLVLPEGVTPPPALSRYMYISRPADFDEFKGGFLTGLRRWLERQESFSTRMNLEEPGRLLRHGEYSAALISAVTLLELTLTTLLDFDPSDRRRKPGLANMVREAEAIGLFKGADEVEVIRSAISMRNKIIHMRGTVTRAEATDYVNAILDFIRRMQESHKRPI